ncbi:hypothetical protein B296_00000047 [Ensete ventricosum]|uniref:Uncharacterized protein n=1 Tax=Ensete ventricosum TaxID=4639 RepID=A0A426ZTL0_ENSVE|nr:hypothetical protein B296_00000047 [Ensete ventricosum]
MSFVVQYNPLVASYTRTESLGWGSSNAYFRNVLSELITGLVGPDLYLYTNSSLVDLPFLPLKLILMATGAEITANKNTTMIGLTEDLYYYANGLELELPAAYYPSFHSETICLHSLATSSLLRNFRSV